VSGVSTSSSFLAEPARGAPRREASPEIRRPVRVIHRGRRGACARDELLGVAFDERTRSAEELGGRRGRTLITAWRTAAWSAKASRHRSLHEMPILECLDRGLGARLQVRELGERCEVDVVSLDVREDRDIRRLPAAKASTPMRRAAPLRKVVSCSMTWHGRRCGRRRGNRASVSTLALRETTIASAMSSASGFQRRRRRQRGDAWKSALPDVTGGAVTERSDAREETASRREEKGRARSREGIEQSRRRPIVFMVSRTTSRSRSARNAPKNPARSLFARGDVPNWREHLRERAEVPARAEPEDAPSNLGNGRCATPDASSIPLPRGRRREACRLRGLDGALERRELDARPFIAGGAWEES